MRGRAGSGPFGSFDAHISWFAHPPQASALPANSDSVPCKRISYPFVTRIESLTGQCSGALEGIDKGSGGAAADCRAIIVEVRKHSEVRGRLRQKLDTVSETP